MPSKIKGFRTGTSCIEYEGQIWKEEVMEAIVTDANIKMDICSLDEDGNPDLEFVQAVSIDNGQTYSGSYRYHRRSYEPGTVEFKRMRRPDGSDMFKGFCIDEEGTRYAWEIVIGPA